MAGDVLKTVVVVQLMFLLVTELAVHSGNPPPSHPQLLCGQTNFPVPP